MNRLLLIQIAAEADRYRNWEPVNCILCPRKQSLIANDRCLEYQAADRCRCPDAAKKSVRQELEEAEAAAAAAS